MWLIHWPIVDTGVISTEYLPEALTGGNWCYLALIGDLIFVVLVCDCRLLYLFQYQNIYRGNKLACSSAV